MSLRVGLGQLCRDDTPWIVLLILCRDDTPWIVLLILSVEADGTPWLSHRALRCPLELLRGCLKSLTRGRSGLAMRAIVFIRAAVLPAL
jgi:hypothetical protein